MSSQVAVDFDLCRELAEFARKRASGIVTATRGKHRRLLCLDRGRLATIVSNVLEEQLDEYLVQEGVLSVAERSHLQIAAHREKRKLFSMLLEAQVVAEDRLQQIALARAEELLRSTLQWPDGELQAARGKPKLDGELTVSLPFLPILLEHTRKSPASLDEVRVRIGPPNIRPVPAKEAEHCLVEVELDETARSILELSNGSRDIAALVVDSGEREDSALRALYGLLSIGLLRPAEQDETAKSAAEDEVSRDEILARIRRTEGASYYDILGLGRGATAEEIREAYYYLARRYHPDRFRSGDLREMLPQIESYFAQVTEAHNNLSDAELRKIYNEDLDSRGPAKEEPKQDTAYLAKQNHARGRLLADKKQYRDAVTFFENAIRLDPSKPLYHLDLGRLLLLNPRQRGEAEAALQEAARLDPARVDTYLALGELYEKSGRVDDAVKSYREALTWEPGHIEAEQCLKKLGAKP